MDSLSREAHVAYLRGDYDGADRAYRALTSTIAHSPMATTAIATMNAMWKGSKTGTPWVNPDLKASPDVKAPEAHAPVPPARPLRTSRADGPMAVLDALRAGEIAVPPGGALAGLKADLDAGIRPEFCRVCGSGNRDLHDAKQDHPYRSANEEAGESGPQGGGVRPVPSIGRCRFCGYGPGAVTDPSGRLACPDAEACQRREMATGLTPHKPVYPKGPPNDPDGPMCRRARRARRAHDPIHSWSQLRNDGEHFEWQWGSSGVLRESGTIESSETGWVVTFCEGPTFSSEHAVVASQQEGIDYLSTRHGSPILGNRTNVSGRDPGSGGATFINFRSAGKGSTEFHAWEQLQRRGAAFAYNATQKGVVLERGTIDVVPGGYRATFDRPPEPAQEQSFPTPQGALDWLSKLHGATLVREIGGWSVTFAVDPVETRRALDARAQEQRLEDERDQSIREWEAAHPGRTWGVTSVEEEDQRVANVEAEMATGAKPFHVRIFWEGKSHPVLIPFDTRELADDFMAKSVSPLMRLELLSADKGGGENP